MGSEMCIRDRSPSGPVSRGICHSNSEGLLTDVVERFKIRRYDNGKIYCTVPGNNQDPQLLELSPGDLCSMNCWGFLPDVYPKAKRLVTEFLAQHIQEPASEYHLPTMVNQIIRSGEGNRNVLNTKAHWIGVTYRAVRAGVMDRLHSVHSTGL